MGEQDEGVSVVGVVAGVGGVPVDGVPGGVASANWRPGQRWRERKSVSHTIRWGAGSMIRSVVRRDDFDVPNLGELVAFEQVLELALRDAVVNLRSQGHSWQTIASELGVTRQAAHERFGPRRDIG
jgi:hypothetical protein